jgi:hypothetical protein
VARENQKLIDSIVEQKDAVGIKYWENHTKLLSTSFDTYRLAMEDAVKLGKLAEAWLALNATHRALLESYC